MDWEFGCQLPGFERTGRSNCIVGGAVDGHQELIPAQSVGGKTPTLNFASLVNDLPAEEDLGLGKNKKGKVKGKVKKGGTEAESPIRLDPFNTPLNSDYDLYSCGKDGQSAPHIDDPLSEDDILRGRDGAYIGPASLYEP
jgi:hypothetical protein